jgi:hypothetical protein
MAPHMREATILSAPSRFWKAHTISPDLSTLWTWHGTLLWLRTSPSGECNSAEPWNPMRSTGTKRLSGGIGRSLMSGGAPVCRIARR